MTDDNDTDDVWSDGGSPEQAEAAEEPTVEYDRDSDRVINWDRLRYEAEQIKRLSLDVIDTTLSAAISIVKSFLYWLSVGISMMAEILKVLTMMLAVYIGAHLTLAALQMIAGSMRPANRRSDDEDELIGLERHREEHGDEEAYPEVIISDD